MFKRIVVNLLLLIVSLGFIVIASEIALRLFLPQVVEVKVNYSWRQDDPELGFVPKPNTEGRMKALHSFDEAFRTNSLGLRGEREYASPAGDRILLLGDSFVFGWGVEDSDTLPAHLERSLQKSGKNIDVVNAGVYAYDTVHYARWNRRIASLDPSITILGFCLENDFYVSKLPAEIAAEAGRSVDRDDVNRFVMPAWFYALKENVLLKSHLLTLARGQLYNHFPDIRKYLFRFGLNNKRDIFLEEYPRFLQGQLEEVKFNLKTLRDDVERAGGRLIVAAVPLREQIYSAEEIERFEGFDAERPNRALGVILGDLGVEYFDLLPGLREKARETGKRFYFENDPHWNADGTRAAAEIIRDFLEAPRSEPAVTEGS